MDDQIAFRFNSYIKAVEQAWQSEESTKTEGSLAVLIAMVDRLTGYVQSLPTRQLQFTENDVLRCLTLIDGLVNKLPKNSRIATDRMVETLTSGTGLKANGVIMRHRQILQQRKEAALAAANKQSKIAVTAADDKPQARTVLLIEDDRIMAKHVSNQLMQYGYFVSWVEDFDSVENLLETGTPDCIISDIRIGDDDTKGTRFFMEMRERNLALPPLIFLSSMTEFSIRLEALRAGGHGFVTKPYSTGELVEVVDSIFEIREKEAMRFVIVDDNERDLVNLSGALTDISAQVRTCRTPDRILDDLAEFRPDVLVLSANMLSVGGIEIAKVVRQDNRYVSLSIVVLTNEGDNQSQAESLIQGSDTFLVKSISPKILAAVLMGQAQRARDIAGLLFHDSLTGLLNHNAIKDRLTAELSRGERQIEKVCLVLFDLDHFKNVNDTYGHPVGDQVLKNFTRLISTRLRHSDSVGRYGGEEFAAVLTNIERGQAITLIDKLRDAFAQVQHDSEKGAFSVTFSAGICESEEGVDSDLMLKRADEALYRAKHDGRNRVVLWE